MPSAVTEPSASAGAVTNAKTPHDTSKLRNNVRADHCKYPIQAAPRVIQRKSGEPSNSDCTALRSCPFCAATKGSNVARTSSSGVPAVADVIISDITNSATDALKCCGRVRLRWNIVRPVSDHCPACVGFLSGIDRKTCPPCPKCAENTPAPKSPVFSDASQLSAPGWRSAAAGAVDEPGPHEAQDVDGGDPVHCGGATRCCLARR